MLDQRKIRETWKQMLENHARLEQKVLQILRHGDATQEQLETARDLYRASYQRMCQAEDAMSQAGLFSGPSVCPPRRFRQTHAPVPANAERRSRAEWRGEIT